MLEQDNVAPMRRELKNLNVWFDRCYYYNGHIINPHVQAAFLYTIAWPTCLIKCTYGSRFLTKQHTREIPIGMMFDHSINLIYLLQSFSVYLRFRFFACLGSFVTFIRALPLWQINHERSFRMCAMNRMRSFIWIRTNWISWYSEPYTHEINQALVRAYDKRQHSVAASSRQPNEL